MQFNQKRYAGQVGYIVSNMRSIKEALVGDTIFKEHQKVEPLPGFKKPKAMVSFFIIYFLDCLVASF